MFKPGDPMVRYVYEVYDGTDFVKHTKLLCDARTIAKRRAKRNHKIGAIRFVVIHKLDIPGNPYAGSHMIEKWIVRHGRLMKKEV